MAKPIDADHDQTRAAAMRAIAELRAAFERSLGLGRELTTSWETMAAQSFMGAREIGDRIGRTFEENVRALFDAAEEHVHSGSPAEIFEIQQRFLTGMVERSLDQAEDLEAILRGETPTFADEIRRTPGG